jgi:hypothetical protein
VGDSRIVGVVGNERYVGDVGVREKRSYKVESYNVIKWGQGRLQAASYQLTASRLEEIKNNLGCSSM